MCVCVYIYECVWNIDFFRLYIYHIHPFIHTKPTQQSQHHQPQLTRQAFELLTELERQKGGEVVKALKARGLSEEQVTLGSGLCMGLVGGDPINDIIAFTFLPALAPLHHPT